MFNECGRELRVRNVDGELGKCAIGKKFTTTMTTNDRKTLSHDDDDDLTFFKRPSNTNFCLYVRERENSA